MFASQLLMIRNGLVLGTGAVLASACVLIGPLETSDGAPPIENDHLIQAENAIPKRESPSKYGNPEYYEVFGKTYRVLDSAQNYREDGVASWYGTKFHGRRTSSGEIYDMYKMTAAHKSLPIPCYVRVRNKENGLSVIVRVNDRGPFHEGRIIDLSYAAAHKLGIIQTGIAAVTVESIDTPLPVVDELGDFYVQVGAYSDKESAESVRRFFRLQEGLPVSVSFLENRAVYRVRIGPFHSKNQALSLIQKYQASRFDGLKLVEQDRAQLTPTKAD